MLLKMLRTNSQIFQPIKVKLWNSKFIESIVWKKLRYHKMSFLKHRKKVYLFLMLFISRTALLCINTSCGRN
jgi:hypothetical protein